MTTAIPVPLIANSHLIPAPPVINTDNEKVEFEDEEEIPQEDKYIKCVQEIQGIFSKGYSVANGKALTAFIQKQRSLVLELMLQSFMNRPDPKMGDSLNTLLGQMEKSVRDDTKEQLKAKEMETTRETFELFRKSMSAVIDGSIVMPTFGMQALVLDPMKPVLDAKTAAIKPEELQQGNILVDHKKIEAALAASDPNKPGNEIVISPAK